MTTTEYDARTAIIEACRRMNALGINQGTSGNISLRHGGDMLITPSATPYEDLRPEMIAAMKLSGADGAWTGPLPTRFSARRSRSREKKFRRCIT
jgi:L-fuculose-phosphate aldolase